MPNEAIEHIAKAIEESILETMKPGMGMDPKKYAVAAIEAMRSVPVLCYDQYRSDKTWRELNSAEVWNLWIDAALKQS